MDEIVRRVSSKQVFPNLRGIVVAGHSAGGQFVTRYEMTNQVHDSISIPISCVVSNAFAYTYVDDMRPTSTAIPKTVAAAAPGFQPVGPAVPPPPFVPYADAKNCVGFDPWPYGLKNRIGYASRLPEDELTEAVCRPANHLPARGDGYPASWYFRYVLSGDGPRPHAIGARSRIQLVRQRVQWREPQGGRCAVLRS